MKTRISQLAALCRGRVLECGCNEGFVAQAIRERGLEVVAVDNNPAMVARCKELWGEDFPVQQADVNALPFEDDSFDTVVGGELLEHLENPGRGLAEMVRVARGNVVLSLPLGPYWLGENTHLWELKGWTILHDPGTITEHDKELTVLQFQKRRKLVNGSIEQIA